MWIQAVEGYIWIAFALFWLITGLLAKPAVRKQSPGSRLFQMIGTIGGFVLIFYYGPWHLGPLDMRIIPASDALNYLGLTLTIAGIGFAIWARVHLGRNWSGSVTVKQDHELIRSGPYAIVRHPIYTGLLLAALGGCISFGMVRCFVGLLLLLICLRFKSRLEERFMEEQFGSEYEAYKRDVKALVPFIW